MVAPAAANPPSCAPKRVAEVEAADSEAEEEASAIVEEEEAIAVEEEASIAEAEVASIAEAEVDPHAAAIDTPLKVLLITFSFSSWLHHSFRYISFPLFTILPIILPPLHAFTVYNRKSCYHVPT